MVTGFVKHDSDKVRHELVPSFALEEVAKVMTAGARKYADENYLKGTNWRRYIGAALRHLHAFARGEDKDPETGCSHLAHMVCCGLMLMEIQRVGTGTDDRVKEVPVAVKEEVKPPGACAGSLTTKWTGWQNAKSARCDTCGKQVGLVYGSLAVHIPPDYK